MQGQEMECPLFKSSLKDGFDSEMIPTTRAAPSCTSKRVPSSFYPLGEDTLVTELGWLPELETKNRLKGDYIWLKIVYQF
jgi:hypothetical protein